MSLDKIIQMRATSDLRRSASLLGQLLFLLGAFGWLSWLLLGYSVVRPPLWVMVLLKSFLQ